MTSLVQNRQGLKWLPGFLCQFLYFYNAVMAHKGGKDVLVIGAGVVGLATARALALLGNNVVVTEAATRIGAGVSSRNSEVLHAGIYYQPGSLKARACVRGHALLRNFCEEHQVPYNICGKLIVATSDNQVGALYDMLEKGNANGVQGLEVLSGNQAMAMEPELRCVAALHSPYTGIVDSQAYMLALQGDLEKKSGMVALGSKVTGGVLSTDPAVQHLVRVSTSSEEDELTFDQIVNCASLHATQVAASFEVDSGANYSIPKSYYAKGDYCTLSAGRNPFSRLIYPVPKDAWLGVHLTLDLSGQARFGPDLEWIEGDVDSLDYRPSQGCSERFEKAVREYWPGLPSGSLAPSYSGIRPRIHGPGETAPDFLLQGPETHKVPGLVNCFGVESPGLTSSMALADEVTRLLSVKVI